MRQSRRGSLAAVTVAALLLAGCSSDSYDSIEALLQDLDEHDIALCDEEDDSVWNRMSDNIRHCTYKGVDLHVVITDEAEEHAESTILGPTLAGSNWFIQVSSSSIGLSSDWTNPVTYDSPPASVGAVLEEIREAVGGEIFS